MSEFNCSFCGINHRQCKRLISGPRVFICDDCVQLACSILVDDLKSERMTLLSDSALRLGEMDEVAHKLRLEVARLRNQLTSIVDAVQRAVPVAIRCMWCELKLDSEELAKEHVASCSKHPAVIALTAQRPPRTGEVK